jgi:GNAT superfamily N-acetyltransferase
VSDKSHIADKIVLKDQSKAVVALKEMVSKLMVVDPPFYALDFGNQGMVILELHTFDGMIRLSLIQVPPEYRGHGLASKAMNMLTAIADKHGVDMSLDAVPQGKGGLTKAQLFKWYAKHGFKRMPYLMQQDKLSDQMERKSITSALAWKKINRDDYELPGTGLKIVRMPKQDNRYTKKDEWTLIDNEEGVDVYPSLMEAKAHGDSLLKKRNIEGKIASIKVNDVLYRFKIDKPFDIFSMPEREYELKKIRAAGWLSFSLRRGPYFHTPDMLVVPRQDGSGLYEMTADGVKKALLSGHYMYKETFELSRRDEEYQEYLEKHSGEGDDFEPKIRKSSIDDVINRIEKRVRNPDLALDMINKVKRYSISHNPADDLSPNEVRMLYVQNENGDDFDLEKGGELDVSWTNHAEYRSELRDVDPSAVNDEIRKFVEKNPFRRFRQKINLIKNNIGKVVVDLDTTMSPAHAGVVTVIAKSKTAGGCPMHMQMIYPPNPIEIAVDRQVAFLGGAIDMGQAVDWQAELGEYVLDVPCFLLNPRRKDWDPTWVQSIDNPEFRQQVEWELAGLDIASIIVLVLTKDSKAPISLLELGLHASDGKMMVFCPEGFYRKGNVDIVCAKYGVPVFADWDEFKEAFREKVKRPVMGRAMAATGREAKLKDLRAFVIGMKEAGMKQASTVSVGDICMVNLVNMKKFQDTFFPQQGRILKDIVRQGKGKVLVETITGDEAYVTAYGNPISRMVGGVEVPIELLRVVGKSGSEKQASMQRHCEIYKAMNGKWYLELADREYEEYDKATTYGPFDSQESADKYLDRFSNPGGMGISDSGRHPVPNKSPNGRPVQKPTKSMWGSDNQRFEAMAIRIADDLDPMAGEKMSKLFTDLHTWVTKTAMGKPSTAPIVVQLLEGLNQVQESLHGKMGLTGSEAVKAFAKAALDDFGGPFTVHAGPFTRLWRKYSVPVFEKTIGLRK